MLTSSHNTGSSSNSQLREAGQTLLELYPVPRSHLEPILVWAWGKEKGQCGTSDLQHLTILLPSEFWGVTLLIIPNSYSQSPYCDPTCPTWTLNASPVLFLLSRWD